MKKISIVSFMMMILTAVLFSACNPKEEPKGIDPANLDLSVDPAHDFDQYANGGWKAMNPLPGDKSRFGSFDKLRDEAEKQLQTLFDEVAAEKHEPGSIGQKIADFYKTGMDTVKIEADGAAPMMPYLNEIEALQTIKEVEELIIRYHQSGNGTLFSFFGSADKQNSDWVIAQLYQGGLGLSDRDYYVSNDKRSEEIREEYVVHMSKMFQLAGDDELQATNKAQKVMALETRLAKASMTRLERRDPHATYNKMDLVALTELSPDFDWNAFFAAMDLPGQKEINVGMPVFFKEISAMMNEVALDDWKAYLSWNVINSAASYLSTDFVDQDFYFYGKVMKGQEENRDRWKRVQGRTSSSLSEAIGQLYVARYFPPEAKERMVNLVENLRIALGERIDQLEWMGDDTKQKAHEKLATINVKIGYPDKWRDYSDLQVGTDSYLANVMRSRAFNAAYSRSKINQPVDKSEWYMPPQMVNAYYSPSMNEIAFPAAILQPPFFYLDADDAVNYGAIGVVIGHEITHGFDDQGRKYDKDGNLNDWWTAEDGQRFDERAQVLVEQYNNFNVLDTVKADGKLTLGENIADLGGLNISLQAFRNAGKKTEAINGFTSEQRFFLSYAHLWASNVRDKELLRLTKEDVHSLGRFRVLGPLRNMPEFHAAFDVNEGDYMYLSPEERAVIW
ncbi:M13 family metallopeptidase [Roseimarinus sediminis]|uniref:M13 family metallopeptidase n=1 Tax=Roseimarinus sediminis TaxID=1610899 RepID=UPI003D24CF96